MKSIKLICSILFITGLFFSANAQSASTETAVKKFYADGWAAYLTFDLDKIADIYSENAISIDPAGGITTGFKQMREAWEGFLKMVDNKPTFTYGEPTIRVLTPNIALITYSYADDIKMQGQQVGGKKTGLMVVQKIKGRWLLVADATVPVQVMPDPTAQTVGKN